MMQPRQKVIGTNLGSGLASAKAPLSTGQLSWERNPTYVLSVGKVFSRTQTSLTIGESTQERSLFSAQSAERGSASTPTLLDTREPTRVRGPTAAAIVGKASLINQP